MTSSTAEQRPLLTTTTSSDLNPLISSSSNSNMNHQQQQQQISYSNLLLSNLFFSGPFVLLAQIGLISFLIQLWIIVLREPIG